MKGHLTLAMTSFVLFALTTTTVLSLKLPGQAGQGGPGGKESETNNRGKDGTWLSGGRAAPSIPMWSFLPRNHGQDRRSGGGSSSPEAHGPQSNLHRSSGGGSSGASSSSYAAPDIITSSRDSDEILRAEDLASLLSSKARLLNNSKRSLSYSTFTGDSSRKTEDVKRSRPYDVPLIECPLADDGMERFSCPTPDAVGRYRCVDDHVLCDGFIDCPNAEDEDRQACMFYKTTKAHLDVLADALLRWARGRR